jgi:uncharacterized protein YkwD
MALTCAALGLATAACIGDFRSPTTPEGVGQNLAFESQVLGLINQRRAAGATCGGTVEPPVAALAMDESLRQAARLHSADMATNGYLAHTSLDGRKFAERMRDAGYMGPPPLDENIAAGQPTPRDAVEAWMASASHCRTIMSADFKVSGVGYAYRSRSTYRHYWTHDLGGG